MGIVQEHEYAHQESIPGEGGPPSPPSTDDSGLNQNDTEKAKEFYLKSVDLAPNNVTYINKYPSSSFSSSPLLFFFLSFNF